MTTDSLFYLVILIASLALAALGWASYLLCALRMSRAEHEAAERSEPVPFPRSAPFEPAEPRVSEPVWRPSTRPTEAPDPIRIAPPARAVRFEPEREGVDPDMEGREADGRVTGRPPEWLLEDILDEHLERVPDRGERPDAGAAWL